MMKILLNTFLVTILAIPLLLQAEVYRWVDANGSVHYSHRIPAADSQLGYSKYRNGFKTKDVSSSKMNREKKLREIQLAKQKQIDSKNEKIRRIREAEDSRLLYIYSNEDELTASYNAKLRLAQLAIDVLKSRHKAQSDKLSMLERRLERGNLGKQADALELQIGTIIDNLKIYQQAITENIIEKAKVQKSFVSTLKRYQRLVAAIPNEKTE